MKPPARVGRKNDCSECSVRILYYVYWDLVEPPPSSLPPPLTLPLSRCLSHPGLGSIRPPALLRLTVVCWECWVILFAVCREYYRVTKLVIVTYSASVSDSLLGY